MERKWQLVREILLDIKGCKIKQMSLFLFCLFVVYSFLLKLFLRLDSAFYHHWLACLLIATWLLKYCLGKLLLISKNTLRFSWSYNTVWLFFLRLITFLILHILSEYFLYVFLITVSSYEGKDNLILLLKLQCKKLFS